MVAYKVNKSQTRNVLQEVTLFIVLLKCVYKLWSLTRMGNKLNVIESISQQIFQT